MPYKSARWQYPVTRHLYGLTLLGQYHSVCLPIPYFVSSPLTDETGGPWLRQPEMLEELAAELEKWGARTGWPVSSIVKSLTKASD